MGKPAWLPPYLDKHWQASKPYRRWVKRSATFFNLHLLYIIVVGFLGALVLWVGPQGTGKHLSFGDAIFHAFSAVCGSGCVTVLMGRFSSFGQVILLILMMVGSNVATSIWPVLIRIHYYRKYSLKRYKIDPLHEDAANIAVNEYTIFPVERPKEMKLGRLPSLDNPDTTFPVERPKVLKPGRVPTLDNPDIIFPGERPQDLKADRFDDPELEEIHSSPASGNGQRLSRDDMPPGSLSTQTWSQSVWDTVAHNVRHSHHTETGKARMGFLGLPDKDHQNAEVVFQRISSLTLQNSFKGDHSFSKRVDEMEEEVGHYLDIIELQALLQLSWLVPTYFFALQALGFVLTCITLNFAPGKRNILEDKNGINPWFFAMFQTSSAFNQVGMCLLDDQYIQLQRAGVFLFIQTILILLGNTMFPVALYAIIWLLQRFSKEGDRKDALNYLLLHPRRCFTHLFPWEETKWLMWTIILFNFVELAFFLGLDWDTPALIHLSPIHKFSVGLGQSVGTRSAGFSFIALAVASPAMWILYLGFMYVAVYPVHLARVNSRVSQPNDELEIKLEANVIKYLSHNSTLVQGWMLIARDSFLVFVAMLLICVFEREKLDNDPATYDVFRVVFEVISLYSSVGLSLGITCSTPNCVAPPYSFVGIWGTPSRVVALFLIVAARHRTLPHNIDYSVVIPKRVKKRRKAMRELEKQGSDGGSQMSFHHKQKEETRPTMMDLRQRFQSNPSPETEGKEAKIVDLNERFSKDGEEGGDEEKARSMREASLDRAREDGNADGIMPRDDDNISRV